MNNLEATIDLSTAWKVVRKRAVNYAWTSLLLSVVLIALFLLLMPQSFTSKISLTFPQSPVPGGALAALAGNGTPNAKYTGVLRSDRFAEEAARRCGIQQMYHLSADKAIDFIHDRITVDDNVRDNLIYVSISLPGPARFAPASAGRREQVKATAVKIANLYGEMLSDYLATSDMDKESVLLRAASDQLVQARRQYNGAVQNMTHFVREHRFSAGGSPGSNSSAADNDNASVGSGGGDSDLQAKRLATLYTAKGQLEADIRAAETAQQMNTRLQSEQLSSLDNLPAEDPMLARARGLVSDAKAQLANTRLQYSDDNPRVVLARERLRIAEDDLRRQTRAIRHGQTSQSVQSKVSLDALRAKYDAIKRQISEAEPAAQISRELMAEFERRRNEVLLRLEVLKTTASQTAMLSLQTVSSKNRVKVVDDARPARSGTPGATQMVLLSLCITLVSVLARIAHDYRAYSRTTAIRTAAVQTPATVD